jgi:hypothetical protein
VFQRTRRPSCAPPRETASQPAAGARGPWVERWSASHRGNHEGYVAGYFIESAINHYEMTDGKDLRLYNAAKKLADCWADHIGPAPKQEWFDGHQEMEQALVRFGRFVNEIERQPGEQTGSGDRIAFTLPLPVQRVYGSDGIVSGNDRPSPVRDRVALRVGPLVYNIEKVDQDITSVLEPSSPLSREWRGDLLGAVSVITGAFAGGARMMAIPNYARYRRNPPPPPPPSPEVGGQRPAPPPAESIVWIREK